ncbi:MAG: hypothetical protein IJV44_09930, partial [Prevotella sp.]|nr:hypothetical protein [Prevotella sp.]
ARRISGSLKHTNVIDGLFFYPSKTRKSHSLLVLLSSLSYVNPLKERFLVRHAPFLARKRVQRYELFPKQQIFSGLFFKNERKIFFLLI